MGKRRSLTNKENEEPPTKVNRSSNPENTRACSLDENNNNISLNAENDHFTKKATINDELSNIDTPSNRSFLKELAQNNILLNNSRISASTANNEQSLYISADQNINITDNALNILSNDKTPSAETQNMSIQPAQINHSVNAQPTNEPSTSTPNYFNNEEQHNQVESNSSVKQEEDVQIIDNSSQINPIVNILSQIKPMTEYAVAGKASEMTDNPELYIKNIGLVNLPLSDLNMDNLSSICSQQSQIANSNVDRVILERFELQPSEIEFRNPDWNDKVNLLAQKAAKDMGFSIENLEPKLSKLVLYKAGGHFLKHRDTYRENNAFATLNIQLPSIYTGGKLIVYGRSTKRVYDFGQRTGEAKSTIQYVAHCNDLEYEVLEVTSGYRLMLIYSLCRIDDESGIYCKDSQLARAMCDALQNLDESNKYMAMLLDRKYDQTSFFETGLSGLNEIDDERCNLLKSANYYLPEESKFSFYIAHVHLLRVKGIIFES